MATSRKQLSAAVSITSSTVVVPAADTPRSCIHLSKLDVGSGKRAHVPSMHLYKPSDGRDSASFFSPARLRQALAMVLVPFYPFAGTLGLDGHGRVVLRCDGAGAMLSEARCTTTMEDFGGDFCPNDESTIDDMVRKLVPSASPAAASCPVFMAQVTRFKCGGVCLGLATHHMVADGSSAFHFINSWAAASRCGDLSAVTPPCIGYAALRARSPPRVEYDHSDQIGSHDTPAEPAVRPAVSTATLHISLEQVAMLKGSREGVSTFTAVMARVWQSVCKARGLAAEERTRMATTVDIRRLLRPPLPQSFLGNAIIFMRMEADVGELLSAAAVDVVAAKMEGLKSRLHDRYVRSLIDAHELREGPMTGPWDLRPSELFGISLLHLPMYDNDFGWGEPALVMRGPLRATGRFNVTKGPRREGGLRLTIALEEESMASFTRCFYENLLN